MTRAALIARCWLVVLVALAIAAPARGQSPDPFLSVPSRPSPAPRPVATARPAPAPATTPTPPRAPAFPTGPALLIATSFGEKGFHCPAAGTVVVSEIAGKTHMVTYAGTDPADPELCTMAVNGKVGVYLFGRIDKNTPSAADIAAAYRKVLSGPPGTAAEFRSVRNDGTNYMYRYKNEALETFQIGGEARPTVRIAFTESGMGGNHFEGTWRRWFDLQTGAVLRQSYQHVSGQPPSNQDWTATSITVPKT